MTNDEIQAIADRVISALENLSPGDAGAWGFLPGLTPIAAFATALVAFIIGQRNLKAQQRALRVTQRSNERALIQQRKALLATQANHEAMLQQKSEADARSEWWRRAQWAFEATDNPKDPENPRDTPRYVVGVEMLEVLGRSKLAGTEEMSVLDAFLKSRPTKMEDESIDDLVGEAAEQEGLTEAEMTALSAYYEVRVGGGLLNAVDDRPDNGDNEDTEEEPHD